MIHKFSTSSHVTCVLFRLDLELKIGLKTESAHIDIHMRVVPYDHLMRSHHKSLFGSGMKHSNTFEILYSCDSCYLTSSYSNSPISATEPGAFYITALNYIQREKITADDDYNLVFIPTDLHFRTMNGRWWGGRAIILERLIAPVDVRKKNHSRYQLV